MPTGPWARFTIALFVAISSVASTLVGVIGHGVARYATVGAVMSAVVLMLMGIDQFAWRWPVVRSFLRIPNLEGTWKVELDSNYEGEGGGTKICFLVIHQRYSAVTVEVLTDVARSCSDTASLVKHHQHFVLAYVYRAEADALRRVGNEPHRGAAELVIEQTPVLRFDGRYWTDRKTFGDIRAVGWSRRKCSSFRAASQLQFGER